MLPVIAFPLNAIKPPVTKPFNFSCIGNSIWPVPPIPKECVFEKLPVARANSAPTLNLKFLSLWAFAIKKQVSTIINFIADKF